MPRGLDSAAGITKAPGVSGLREKWRRRCRSVEASIEQRELERSKQPMPEELNVGLTVRFDAVDATELEAVGAAVASVEIDVRLDEDLRPDRALEQHGDRRLQTASTLHACGLRRERERRVMRLKVRRDEREAEARVVLG